MKGITLFFEFITAWLLLFLLIGGTSFYFFFGDCSFYVWGLHCYIVNLIIGLSLSLMLNILIYIFIFSKKFRHLKETGGLDKIHGVVEVIGGPIIGFGGSFIVSLLNMWVDYGSGGSGSWSTSSFITSATIVSLVFIFDGVRRYRDGIRKSRSLS